MKAAETSASSAIADWTPLAVVSRSCTTAEMDTFISDVSTTRTNIAIASRTATRTSPFDSAAVVASTLIARQSNGEMIARGSRARPLAPAGERAPGSRHCLRRCAEPLVELRRERRRPDLQVDLEEALEAPGLEVAGSGEHLLAVAHERLGVEHGRVLEDPHARVEQGRRGGTAARPRTPSCSAFAGTNSRTRTPRRAALSMRRIMPRSVT